MDSVMLAGLIRVDLPEETIRLVDGGVLNWNGELYRSADPVFGSIGAAEPLTEGVGDEVPALRLTFLPASTAAAATLSRPGYQGSRVRFWIAEVDPGAGTIVGTPDLLFDGQTDRTRLVTGRGTRVLEMDLVSRAERLFAFNDGNRLEPRFHRKVWLGEGGEDFATGLAVTVAWGIDAPRGVGVGGGATGGGVAGGGGGISGGNVRTQQVSH